MPVISYDNNDFTTLKKTIWAEARGECFDGQVGVAWVIINRARHNLKHWGGRRIADVCRMPYQFECWNNKHDIPITGDHNVYEAMDTWLRDLLEGRNHPDNTRGSDHYNNRSKESPAWADQIPKTVKIGDHQFYKERN